MKRGKFKHAPAITLYRHATVGRADFARPDLFDPAGAWHRAISIHGVPVLIKARRSGIIHWQATSNLRCEMLIRQRVKHLLVPLPLLEANARHIPSGLRREFLQLSPLPHVASDSLEEALIKAVIRQVIRAGHASQLLHRFVSSFGKPYDDSHPRHFLFPTRARLRSLSDDELRAAGLGFKVRAIRAILDATTAPRFCKQILGSPRPVAIESLQRLPGVGPWTARIALCDLTADWSIYPFDDLAVRTWAKNLWPEKDWPDDPVAFSNAWTAVNGEFVGVVTFYLLALAALRGQRFVEQVIPSD